MGLHIGYKCKCQQNRVALGGLTIFGLSLFEESAPFVGAIEQVILQPPSVASLLDMVRDTPTPY